MTIKFTAIGQPVPKPPKPSAEIWIRPAGKLEVEEQLFHFLRSSAMAHPQAARPLVVDKAALCAIYADPHPDLGAALRQCLDTFLIELGPDAAAWGEFDLSPAILGLALVAYTALIPPLAAQRNVLDPLVPFGTALVETLPIARELPELLAYHAVLHRVAEALPQLRGARAALLRALLDRSPLTAICQLDTYTPPVLTPLAAELLRGWDRRVMPAAPWRSLDEWLDVLSPGLARPEIARYLRHRWLSAPETRPACRNLGLLLEALRRRGDQRPFVLGYYEAYDRFAAQTLPDAWGRPHRRWPLMGTIERFLRVQGESDAAIVLNRWGNEYFLKFHALIETVKTENSLPSDFRLLTWDLLVELRRLMDWTSEPGHGPHVDFGNVEFRDEEQQL